MIATRITMTEWETRRPEPGSELHGRFLDSPQAFRLAGQLSQSGMLQVTELRNGLLLQASSFVGRVTLGDLEITVLPKLDRPSLLNLLRYAYGFRRLKLFSEMSQSMEQFGFEDLLISQLNAEVAELIARGLHRSYIGRREELSSPRGRIDVRRLANSGGTIVGALPCHHHPRVQDSFLNRVLLSGLCYAAAIAGDIHLKRESRRLAAAFQDSVSFIHIDRTTLEHVAHQLNRLTRAYEPAVALIYLLWESWGVSLSGSVRSAQVPGFLFDMNRFFQAVLSRFIREHLPDYTVREEHGLRGMLRFDPKHNPRGQKAPTPRPDFAVLRKNKLVAVLDSKYRDLWKLPLPREMLYQLAMYAAVQEQRVATILYPTLEEEAREARIDVCDPLCGAEIGQVRLRPVLLPRLEQLITAETRAGAQQERLAYASWLAFG